MWKFNQTDDLPGDSLYHSTDELYHYGVLGMKWKHHKARLAEYDKKYDKESKKILSKTSNANSINKRLTNLNNRLNKEYKDSIDYKIKRDKRIKYAKIIGGTAAIAAGAYAVNKYLKKKGIKFQTERSRQAQEWAKESKRLDNLLKTSNKTINNFSKELINKDNLNKLSSTRNISSASDIAKRKAAYDLLFK